MKVATIRRDNDIQEKKFPHGRVIINFVDKSLWSI